MPSDLRATYRLQLRREFNFHDAAEIAGYLAQLGITHLYLSPVLQAADGSTHGYDVVDPTRLSADLGGEDGWKALVAACRRHGLGIVLDVVPNHMAAADSNPWWRDTLENGPASKYATYFDIDWESLAGRLLLPVLGDHYGALLESRQIRVACADGAFEIHYGDQHWPVSPRSLSSLLAAAAERVPCVELAWLADAFEALPTPHETGPAIRRRRHRDKAILGRRLSELLARTECAAAIDGVLADWNEAPEKLDALLEQQNYRLVHWRTAQQELGYRRFFDVNGLVALAVEEACVFDDAHELVVGMVRRGEVHALRVDHPDGLRNPGQYLRRLRDVCGDVPVFVEKILEPGEPLPPWPVAGTTGYDFMQRLNALLTDPAGEQPLTALYAEFTGAPTDYYAVRRARKRAVLETIMGSDVHRLTDILLRISRGYWQHRDYTRADLRAAIVETAAAFDVYRTYPDASAAPGPQPAVGDRRTESSGTDSRLSSVAARDDDGYIRSAIEAARQADSTLSPRVLAFLSDVLQRRLSGPLEDDFAARFAQLTAPAMAKGAEDTAFYTYNRLLSQNEVGGSPAVFSLSLEEWHSACATTAASWPLSMLSTSTHDTKRGEDARARLLLLAQIPGRWAREVRAWRKRAAAHRVPLDRPPRPGFEPAGACACVTPPLEEVPDANSEYFLYQTLVAAWPIEPDRLWEYLRKAVREAKVHTSWLRPDDGYESALERFARALLDDEAFTTAIAEFVSALNEAARIVSLVQTLLKLTAPGTPDFYQGTELWHHALVDPDNRRPVDYESRRRLLSDEDGASAAGVLARWDDALPKLRVIRRTLDLRRRRPDLLGPSAAYAPLPCDGPEPESALAFLRGDGAAVLVPRYPLRLPADRSGLSCRLPDGSWRNLFTDELFTGQALPLRQIWSSFPVALLVRETPEGSA